MSGRQGHLVIIRMFPIRLTARTGQHRDGIDRPKPLRGTVEGCRGACNPKSRWDDKDGSVSIMHACMGRGDSACPFLHLNEKPGTIVDSR